MDYPTFVTTLIGALSLSALAGIDWLVWSFRPDVRRQREVASDSVRGGEGFKKAA
jgi:hypothetical protein